MSNSRLDCVICGVGGQGTVLTSRLIAHVLMRRGLGAKTAETIGMAQRGGSVVGHVRTGSAFSPLVPKHAAGCLIAFEPGEAVRCIDFLALGATLVTNIQAVQPPSAALEGDSYDGTAELSFLRSLGDIGVIEVDGAALCAQAGSNRVLNVVLLAAAVKHHALLDISREELEEAVRARVKERYVAMNLEAIRLVFDA